MCKLELDDPQQQQQHSRCKVEWGGVVGEEVV
jgi:hypothetical protein